MALLRIGVGMFLLLLLTSAIMYALFEIIHVEI